MSAAELAGLSILRMRQPQQRRAGALAWPERYALQAAAMVATLRKDAP